MNHPPFEPKDLQGPPVPGPQFIELLHRQRIQKYPDPPAFYQALFDSALAWEDLQLWVKNLYSYFEHGLWYSAGAILAKTANEEATRIQIIKKLVNIEGREVVKHLNGATTPGYEELWLRFGEGLGLTRDEIASWKTFTRSYFAVEALCSYSRWWEWTWLDGIASFYAADLLASELMPRCREVLRSGYGVADGELDFFTNFGQDAANDLSWEEEALEYWACTTERQLTAARAFRNRLDIEYQLVVPLQVAAREGHTPLQVP